MSHLSGLINLLLEHLGLDDDNDDACGYGGGDSGGRDDANGVKNSYNHNNAVIIDVMVVNSVRYK